MSVSGLHDNKPQKASKMQNKRFLNESIGEIKDETDIDTSDNDTDENEDESYNENNHTEKISYEFADENMQEHQCTEE